MGYTATVVRFVAETLIRTARGDVAVEDLQVGDIAVTASGEHRPIRWIGSTTIDCLSHPHPETVLPVRIMRDAVVPGRPSRDLFVTPGHGLCLDLLGEVLVPVSSLINGATIAQTQVDTVTCWPVELDSHDILIAEGMPAESYIDVCNRAGFSMAQGVVDLAAYTRRWTNGCLQIPSSLWADCKTHVFLRVTRHEVGKRWTRAEAAEFPLWPTSSRA